MVVAQPLGDGRGKVLAKEWEAVRKKAWEREREKLDGEERRKMVEVDLAVFGDGGRLLLG